MEIWKEVVGYESIYMVSDLGRVRSFTRHSGGRVLNPPACKQGYINLLLYKDGRIRGRGVHALVLEAFVGPCPAGMETCHKDGNPQNNHLANLRWDTPVANHADKIRHGTRPTGSKNPKSKLVEADIPRIKRLHTEGVACQSIARLFDVSASAIFRIISGKTWRHA